MAVTPGMSVGKVVVGAVAAVAAGVTFASYALPFAAYAGLQGLLSPRWPGILAYGLPVLLLALVVLCSARRH